MLKDAQQVTRRESGFTLIELLVVMIIIAILMAVAVPTFLSQKNNAQKTKATGNIKQLVTAIDSCAAQYTSGTYYEAGSPLVCLNATDATNGVKSFERALNNLTLAQNNGTAVNTYYIMPLGPTNAQVAPNAVNAVGYAVKTVIQDGNIAIAFVESHRADGTLLKICGPATIAPTALVGVPQSGSRTCKTGKW